MEVIFLFMESNPLSSSVLGGALLLLVLMVGIVIGRSRSPQSVPSNVTEAGQMDVFARVFLGIFILVSGLILSLFLIFIWPPDGPLADQRPFVFDSTFGSFTLERAQQMWLIAGISGMLGAFLHACVSFADFVGNRRLVSSWGWWYLMRGPVGAALGMLFYASLRSSTMQIAGIEHLNPYTVVSLCGLAGLSSKQAINFLQERFSKLLASAPTGTKDTLGGLLNITAIDPQRLRTKQASRLAITAAGINSGTQPYLNNVRLRTMEPDRIAQGVLVAEIDPDQIPTRGTYDLVLRNADGSVSSAAKVKIEDGPGSGPPPPAYGDLRTLSAADAAKALLDCDGRGMATMVVVHDSGVAPHAGDKSLEDVRQAVLGTTNVLIRSVPLDATIFTKRTTDQLSISTSGKDLLNNASACDGYVMVIDRGGDLVKVFTPTTLNFMDVRKALEQAVAP